MKHLLTFAVLLFVFASCKKDIEFDNRGNEFIKNVKANLKDNVSVTDYDSLDFSKAVQSRINKDSSFLRIPVKGKSIKNEFVPIGRQKKWGKS